MSPAPGSVNFLTAGALHTLQRKINRKVRKGLRKVHKVPIRCVSAQINVKV